ncbi:hypothetical protein Sru01_69380 [Sphaerisporangium rufum]|uniref:Nitroreductase family deazaflavin-dependent oxidoreductase n=1 Tax=Sphaerisporangium rufum TaxID=1381558 RepID=A0A919V2A8_9ACTN|nr:nitroreductase family deazaflavin-dependent oxidoreductase [Sphaerisporangium rufum]GII81956.1 hypothetical protein Sru01_69380 [Sphaerisporangium rufum]
MADLDKQRLTDANRKVIESFRRNGGRVPGWFQDGESLLLLTTVGARSGRPRTSPVMYRREEDRVLIFGSYAGADRHPDWYHNLVKNPEVTVEIGDGTTIETYSARATVLQGEERDRVYAAQARDIPQFAEYQTKTDRIIPVVALHRTTADERA